MTAAERAATLHGGRSAAGAAVEGQRTLTASEFAFLALGLVMGVASGAALIVVLRARPPLAREVRVTVSPNAIRSRMAATLAEPLGHFESAGPARGGPADRRWGEDADMSDEHGVGRRAGDHEPLGAGARRTGGSGTPVQVTPATSRPERPAPIWLRPIGAPSAGLVAVPMSLEPDPITTALRATAAAAAVAAMARTDVDAVTRSQPPPDTARADGRIARPAAIGIAGGERPAATAAGKGPAPLADRPADAPATSVPLTAAAIGPCTAERRIADERCAVATRAREGATTAADAIRRAQRSYDELVGRADAAAALADPRSVRAAKEQAQHHFREARVGAKTRGDVEAAARTWLADINRINRDTREATVGIERDRAAAAALSGSLERLAVEADAARISAERADEACIGAREAVAACDEATALDAAAVRNAPPDGAREHDAHEPGAASPAAPAGAGPGASQVAAATPEPDDEFASSTPMNSHDGSDALIIRILRGDREAMQHAVARLAGDDPDAHRLWQTQLGNLVEALIARAIEASAFDFPIDHPFWGPFNQSQNRDIAAGLSSLGYRFDGFGSWADDHQPSQRDLSLAVGYAGLDPMRVRRWPNEAETGELLRDVRVAADEYVAGAAGGLTLGELVTLLGRRADGLAELWNQWGSVRPILLEAG